MSKSTGPLMSLGARGQVGKSINYSGWKGITRVKINRKPKNPQTTTQQANRNYLTEAVGKYKELESEEKLMWEEWVL